MFVITLISLLSDGVVDVLVTCMASGYWALKPRDSTLWLDLFVFLIPFSLNLSDALGFCKQHSDKPCPSQHPAVICPHPHLAAACTWALLPGLPFSSGSTSLCTGGNTPHGICLHLQQTRGLVSYTWMWTIPSCQGWMPRLWHVPSGLGCISSTPSGLTLAAASAQHFV